MCLKRSCLITVALLGASQAQAVDPNWIPVCDEYGYIAYLFEENDVQGVIEHSDQSGDVRLTYQLTMAFMMNDPRYLAFVERNPSKDYRTLISDRTKVSATPQAYAARLDSCA